MKGENIWAKHKNYRIIEFREYQIKSAETKNRSQQKEKRKLTAYSLNRNCGLTLSIDSYRWIAHWGGFS